MSSVTPADSVSAATGPKKKAKPGRKERAAARSATGSTGGKPASDDKAAMFASSSFSPVAKPGHYPVVFATGAGEPTRDQEFAILLHKLNGVLPGFKEKYKRHPKYVEFRTNADIEDGNFSTHLQSSFLLRLAQQIVHAHVNMGLPQGDYAAVASSDVPIPAALAAVVAQFGEFSVPSIGTRFLLRDYDAAVSRVVWLADQIWSHGNGPATISRAWLPMSANDGNYKAIIAGCLNKFLEVFDVQVSPNELEEAVLSGDVPDAWEGVKNMIGDSPADGQRDQRNRFDFLFRAYANEGAFFAAHSSEPALSALDELGLSWSGPSAGHLNWQYNTKARFAAVSELWARLSPAYAKFFELSSGLATRSSASGTAAQMAEVTETESVTVVKTFLALSAPEFSLAACFPPSCVFVGGLSRRVVVTTPLNVAQRATEFCQKDWRS